MHPINSPNPLRLHRSRSDKMIGGVFAGLGERYGIDPTWLRLGGVAALFMTGFGPMIMLYILAMIIIPEAAEGRPAMAPEEEDFWRDVSDRPAVTLGQMRYSFMKLEDRLETLERAVTADEYQLRQAFEDLERRT